MTRACLIAAVSATIAAGGYLTVDAFGDPPVTGQPATVYKTVTETTTTASLYHGHSAGYLALRLRQTRVHLRASVLRQRSLARRLRNETRAARAAARDYRDDFGIHTDPLANDFLCIHGHEGDWNDPGAPYWGGVQADRDFMRTYLPGFYSRLGTADNWPPFAQITMAMEAYYRGRGFYPWPNTARACGLLR